MPCTAKLTSAPRPQGRRLAKIPSVDVRPSAVRVFPYRKLNPTHGGRPWGGSGKRDARFLAKLLLVAHLAARKDQSREPVEGNEILSVIQRRLLAKLPGAEAYTPVATAYQEIVTQMRRAYAQGESEKAQAEEEGIALRDRILAAYPFHPALIDLMRERWAAIPDFQRTRGALRFLAACLRADHRAGKSRATLGRAPHLFSAPKDTRRIFQ